MFYIWKIFVIFILIIFFHEILKWNLTNMLFFSFFCTLFEKLSFLLSCTYSLNPFFLRISKLYRYFGCQFFQWTFIGWCFYFIFFSFLIKLRENKSQKCYFFFVKKLLKFRKNLLKLFVVKFETTNTGDLIVF